MVLTKTTQLPSAIDPKKGLWLSPNKYALLAREAKPTESAIDSTRLTLHNRPYHPKVLPPISTPDPGEYQCDLTFYDKYAHYNSGYKSILVLINVQSRKMYTALLKSKSDAADELMRIIPTLNPPMTKLVTDAGKEFINKKLTNLLKSNMIEFVGINKKEYTTGGPTMIVERANKTLRDLIERYVTLNPRNKFQYYHALKDITDNYNSAPHSALTLDGRLYSPNTVTPTVLSDLYVKSKLVQMQFKHSLHEHFPIGSFVRRTVGDRNRFTKGAVNQFSEAVYRVVGYANYRVLVVPQSDPKATPMAILYPYLTRVGMSHEEITSQLTASEKSTAQKLEGKSRLKRKMNAEGIEASKDKSEAPIASRLRSRV